MFEDEELSSSQCDSGEESGYSQQEGASDMFGQDESSAKQEKKLASLGGGNNPIKIPPQTTPNEKGDQSSLAKATPFVQESSDDSDMFDPEEKEKLNWQ